MPSQDRPSPRCYNGCSRHKPSEEKKEKSIRTRESIVKEREEKNIVIRKNCMWRLINEPIEGTRQKAFQEMECIIVIWTVTQKEFRLNLIRQ